jgi:hypothetical protein
MKMWRIDRSNGDGGLFGLFASEDAAHEVVRRWLAAHPNEDSYYYEVVDEPVYEDADAWWESAVETKWVKA